jgi:hypothetical protein
MNRVDSVRDAFSYIYDFTRRNSRRTLKPIDTDYKFLNVNPMQLRLSEIGELHAEYVRLVKENMELRRRCSS